MRAHHKYTELFRQKNNIMVDLNKELEKQDNCIFKILQSKYGKSWDKAEVQRETAYFEWIIPFIMTLHCSYQGFKYRPIPTYVSAISFRITR